MSNENLRVKAAGNFKGELVLPSLGNRPLKSDGKEVPLNDVLFWKDDVQRAWKSGLIEFVGLTPIDREATQERILVQSLHGKQLILPSVGVHAISCHDVFEVSGDVFQNTDVQQAIAHGLLKRVTDDDPAVSTAESIAALVAKLEGGVDAEKPVSVETTEATDPDFECEVLDAADKFKLTGKAKTMHRESPMRPPNVPKPYDPRPAAERDVAVRTKLAGAMPDADAGEKAGKGGKKKHKGIKPVGRARKPGDEAAEAAVDGDEAIEITMLTSPSSGRPRTRRL